MPQKRVKSRIGILRAPPDKIDLVARKRWYMEQWARSLDDMSRAAERYDPQGILIYTEVMLGWMMAIVDISWRLNGTDW